MRYGLPIWQCLSKETQDKLAKLLTSTPPCEWQEWQPDEKLSLKVEPLPIRDLEEAREYYDKFMRQAPVHQAKVK